MNAYRNHEPTWPEIMRPPIAAGYLSISASKLAKLRMRENQGEGPPFAKLGGVVVYRRSDLDLWLEKNKKGGAELEWSPKAGAQ